MHRSGTTWLGEMLCAGSGLVRIQEPLNVRNRQTILRSRVSRWYTYITEANEAAYLRFYRDAVAFRPHPLHDIRRMRLGSPRDPFRIGERWGSLILGRFQNRRLLLKDPFAVFSLDWFVRRLHCQVAVTVRHPAAVVSSLKRLGYTFDFSHLLEQPLLMERELGRYRSEMEAALSFPEDVVGQGALLWKMIYQGVADLRVSTNDVQVVRHEDISRAPLAGYERLYAWLDLPFTERAKRKIERYTSEENRKEVSTSNPGATKLDSRANLENWRRRLTAQEIHRVRELSASVWPIYYGDDDW
jgi:hypothetical protein